MIDAGVRLPYGCRFRDWENGKARFDVEYRNARDRIEKVWTKVVKAKIIPMPTSRHGAGMEFASWPIGYIVSALVLAAYDDAQIDRKLKLMCDYNNNKLSNMREKMVKDNGFMKETQQFFEILGTSVKSSLRNSH